jgi:hypothetical protein
MGKKNSGVGSGMNIPDHIAEKLETIFWVKKNLNSLMRIRIRDPGSFDPGSRMEKFGSGIQYKHPGSATLVIFTMNVII